ncbi:unnamed protein product [Nesidiocoris tenuis]|uniref:Uncharacterized protein n=1 Tax=Nesidiocoris tenuis TaxID=355587 RepID=A0A6H5GA28_9HEMI|nr:unnamed protein product [Nesidiocoris tenuis]
MENKKNEKSKWTKKCKENNNKDPCSRERTYVHNYLQFTSVLGYRIASCQLRGSHQRNYPELVRARAPWAGAQIRSHLLPYLLRHLRHLLHHPRHLLLNLRHLLHNSHCVLHNLRHHLNHLSHLLPNVRHLLYYLPHHLHHLSRLLHHLNHLLCHLSHVLYHLSHLLHHLRHPFLNLRQILNNLRHHLHHLRHLSHHLRHLLPTSFTFFTTYVTFFTTYVTFFTTYVTFFSTYDSFFTTYITFFSTYITFFATFFSTLFATLFSTFFTTFFTSYSFFTVFKFVTPSSPLFPSSPSSLFSPSSSFSPSLPSFYHLLCHLHLVSPILLHHVLHLLHHLRRSLHLHRLLHLLYLFHHLLRHLFHKLILHLLCLHHIDHHHYRLHIPELLHHLVHLLLQFFNNLHLFHLLHIFRPPSPTMRTPSQKRQNNKMLHIMIVMLDNCLYTADPENVKSVPKNRNKGHLKIFKFAVRSGDALALERMHMYYHSHEKGDDAKMREILDIESRAAGGGDAGDDKSESVPPEDDSRNLKLDFAFNIINFINCHVILGSLICCALLLSSFTQIPNNNDLLKNVSHEMNASLVALKGGDERQRLNWDVTQFTLKCCGLSSFIDWCEPDNGTVECHVPNTCFTNRSNEVSVKSVTICIFSKLLHENVTIICRCRRKASTPKWTDSPPFSIEAATNSCWTYFAWICPSSGSSHT